MEIDREHVADLAAHEEVLHLRAGRGVAVVEGDAEVAAGALRGVEDALAHRGGRGEGFFRDDVAAGLEGAHDIVGVGGVDGGDDDEVGLRLADHFFEIDLGVARGHGGAILRRAGLRDLDPPGVEVAEGDQLGVFLVGFLDGVLIHEVPRAAADDGIAPAGRHGLGEGGRGGAEGDTGGGQGFHEGAAVNAGGSLLGGHDRE